MLKTSKELSKIKTMIKKDESMQELSNIKTMEYLLEKHRSRQKIEIICDEHDDWFLYINWIEKRTAQVTHSSLVIRKDIPSWLRYLGTMGWKQKEIK